MKLLIAIAVTMALLFNAPALLSQQANPSTLKFEAVPPNTSPAEDLAFTNDGSTQLSLSVSVSAPFAISENRCANGVKPGTHCNLYLTYTPQSVGETDSGTLTINYGAGVTTVALNGQGVSSIPTVAELRPIPGQCSKVHIGDSFNMNGTLGVEDKYYALPTGEQVNFSCTNGSETVDLGSETLEACSGYCPGKPHDIAPASITPDQLGQWSCTMTYNGDGILGATSATVKFIVGEKYVHRICN
jgi:hypothetical protein